nr:hypothetical protein [Tanacetum cinerariifolium]
MVGKGGRGTWEVKVRCGDDSAWRGCRIRAGDDRGIVKLFWQGIWLGQLGAGVWVWANYTTGPCDAWVTGRGSPYYPVDNRVVASWVAVYRGVARSRAQIVLFARPQILCSPWPRACYASLRIRGARVSCGRVRIMFLAARMILYIIMPPQSSVSFVREEDITRLRSAWFSAVNDPLSVDEAMDLPCVELLNENRSIIRKYPKIFLCLVGLSRSFTETDVRLTLLHNNDEEMDLLDFVNAADPFKVKTGERTLAENDVPFLTETEDRVISPSLQTISLVDQTIQDELNVNVSKRKKRVAFVFGSPPMKKVQTEGVIISDSRPSTASKSPTALRRLNRQSGQADTGFGSAAPATEDVTSSSVTPTLEHASEGDNVRTRPSSGYFVVLSSGSADTDIPTSPQVVLLVSSAQAGVNVPVTEPGSTADDFYESQTIDSATALNVCVPNWNITNNARIDNPVTSRNLLDHVTPPGYWAAIRNQHDAEFLDSFNINSAQHVCMVSELCLRYEHEIMTKEKYEMKFTDSAAMVQQRNAEKANLRARLEKSEAKAAKNANCDGLRDQVAGEGKMREEFVSQQDAAERRFSEQAAALDARIADMRRDMDNDLYPHILTAVVGQRWVVGHGIRLAVHKCARSVECRSALGKSLKDSSLALIMSTPTLKDDHDNTDATPEFFFREEGVMSASSSTLGGASSSAPPHGSSLSVADNQVSTLVLSGDGGLA